MGMRMWPWYRVHVYGISRVSDHDKTQTALSREVRNAGAVASCAGCNHAPVLVSAQLRGPHAPQRGHTVQMRPAAAGPSALQR